ncbi:putative GTP-binding elongation factor tu family protein [Leptomonas pyrrhocoris]|uniref:Putative GTP-binding elongation factor tu family protein n=1 Tax=Leptomonas pyrrhocoris TaxID=157538 RepID=A0A0M9G7U4_LEPPY|nr:putative GTP-binding elongation factor tu family protein [Leptomonas pyrrhocoris]KPA84367.1 putative GTP-binding elongation factor tu family protein [Leptomonas pyrrhocoris]|eukprot:XP_015662806.1 putative GTP-binding elongation factor tu family protein [Leptomonas pyrrhocoris]
MIYTLGLVLYEPPAERPLGEWVTNVAVRRGLKEDLDEVQCSCVSDSTEESAHDSTSSSPGGTTTALQAVTAHLEAALASKQASAAGVDASSSIRLLCLVVVIFWDGQAEKSRASLTQLKQLSDKKWLSVHVPDWGEQVEVVVQALNAKKGEASIMLNEAALVSSLRKKLQTSTMAAKGWWREGQVNRTHAAAASNAPAQHADPAASSSLSSTSQPPHGSNANAGAVLGEIDLSEAAVRRAVEDGQGECFFLLSDRDRQGLAEKVEMLHKSCAAAELGCAPVMAEPREVHLPHGGTGNTSGANSSNTTRETAATAAASTTAKSSASSSAVLFAQEFLLRRSCPPAAHLELRLAMCGNVDSGKSTLTSVLTRGCRDDGRGLARAFVFNHKHEAMTGRTSSISENHLGFSATGGVVNYALLQPHRADAVLRPLAPAEVARQLTSAVTPASAGRSSSSSPAAAAGATVTAASAHMTRPYTPQELASRSSKVVTLYDLAGHERYLKTTVLGMTRNMPDYACIVISANNGIQRMTKEHLALCLALKLPFFIVVTRIDATPPNVHEETVASIHKLLKIPTVRKLPYPVRRHDEVILAAKNLRHDRIAPVFEVSNVTGIGIPEVLQFINLLPIRKDWRLARTQPKEMIIDSTFFVTGVGTVVGGIITQGVFRVNDTVLLGPDGFGHFRPVSIKSIHIKGVDSVAAEAGNDAAFCLKKEKRSAIRKGNILADAAHPPTSFWQFEAEITILYHSTTITANYEPVIHSSTVRQSARITYVAQEILRTGDKSLARFHFLYRPEYMKEGQRLIFREGRTKGIGTVTKLMSEPDEHILAKNKLRKKMQEKAHAPVMAR